MWAWLELNLTPKRYHLRQNALVDRTQESGKIKPIKGNQSVCYCYFFECTLIDTLTAKNSSVSSWAS